MTAVEGAHSALDAEQVGYKQTLGRRHVQMIAIGGAIGTGLFLGSASRLHSTGPALIFSYAFVGVIAYFLMRALGELVLHRATSGAFVSYMREFYGERAAYVTGWMYWLNWALTGIAELSAVGLYMQYWFPDLPKWMTVLVALAVVLTINLLSARAFGEFEFWAAILKVAAIVVFLIVGLVVVVGHFDIGGHEAGVQNLWSNPGGFWPTAGGFDWYGPILVMSGVIFAYAAIEMVGVAAGEMENPEREVPKAVNAVIMRIAVFYCGSILLLVSMLPTSEFVPGISPFVTVFDRLGLNWMGAAIQVILIIAAMSSLNSGLYSTGRVLRSLGMSKQAPSFTLKMSASGVPWAGIVMTSVVYVFGALLNALAEHAFEIALEAAAIGVVFTWASIFLCQIRLRRLSDRGVIPPSPFPAPFSPWTSIVGLVFLALVIVGMAISGWQASPYFWEKTNFLVVVIGIPVIALVLGIGWLYARPKVVADTGGRMQSVWTDDGPRYADEEPLPPTGREER
ncbi:amino acid permease [Pimelobacter simplex]|uniref:L-asparagine permease n=1 Tax=Nocardioides simplex TaxID=2045 RepID=A0A0C5XB71_NOCSI|nr:amino acid permease [Pimelobacter simplex]AJR18505.1 L-asparagine permease [Pimelobacter simplex]MCG8152658.1 amino acid permease [Pimelobacter simplex]GEB16966.1 L-asparagine permease [Pimelobacter simplex]SFM75363.1 L-asparagine permease [Pimelobacter simplex]